MGIQQYTYWSVTINNPDENDMVLVRNPNDKYVRQFIYTMEEGQDGTPHVQGWCRLHRNQTLTFMKRLYPRAHLKPIVKDEYNENTHDYAQKNDATTRGKHVITTTEALQTIETVMVRVINIMIDETNEHNGAGITCDLEAHRKQVQRELVKKDYRLAKFFVSAVYKSMWKEYGHEMYENIFHARVQEQYEQQRSYSKQDWETISEDQSGSAYDEGDQDSETSETQGSDQSSSSQIDEECSTS